MSTGSLISRPWDNRIFRARTALFALRIPQVAQLVHLKEALAPPTCGYVPLLSLQTPETVVDLALPNSIRVSADLALAPPEAKDASAATLQLPALFLWQAGPAAPSVEDMTWWFTTPLLPPLVESVFKPLGVPGRAGKKYDEQVDSQKAEDRQTSFFESTVDLDERCIHGLMKGTCEQCERNKGIREVKAKAAKSRTIDVFDLILPLLQPPLGENFDNPIILPQGKSLYPFQCEGVRFLTQHEAALLGDEMGTGKSIQAIMALRFLLRSGKVKKCLLLCPKSVLFEWSAKLWEWSPEIQVCKVRGNKDERRVLWDLPAHLYLTTYETLREDIDQVDQKSFDLCILDEIQRIKNPDAGVTQATRSVKAKMRWGLSGTPLENRVEELISIFAYIKPGLLRLDDSPSRVKNLIGPYFLRRRVADVLKELPEKQEQIIWLDLSPDQRRAYDRAESEGRVALSQGQEITVQHVLALITKLKQICNLAPVTHESSKSEYLIEQIEELQASGEKALVFSQYPDKTLEVLKTKLEAFKPEVFHGQLSDRRRKEMIDEFQNSDEFGVLLMSVKAGGMGLTLTRANHVFHFDHWWNPAVAKQAEGRAHRIGQKKTVFVKTLFTVDTIEQRIYQLLQSKQSLFNEVIDDLSDTNLGKMLTEDELFGLFGLKKPRQEPEQAGPAGILGRIVALSPKEFEERVAELYQAMRFHVSPTPFSRDGGVDIFAKRFSDAGVESLAIQCKHYPRGQVGVQAVRELYGILNARKDVSKAVLVTSGEFSSEALNFARGKNLELIAGDRLAGLFLKYKVPIGSQAV
jgi:superfamily II DNA or RNA helicase